MSWNTLIGQERAVASLKRIITSGKVGHAYLFHGPDGSGKRAAAVEFAKALQCEKGGEESCDSCSNCSKVSRFMHADVHFYFAQPKDTPDEEIAPRLKLLSDNPYAEVDFVRRPFLSDPEKQSGRKTIYNVDRIRDEFSKVVSRTPHEGRFKILILTDAELFNDAAANAFLKMLEEPAPRTIFILTSSRPELLLPTVASRCQRIRFDMLSDSLIEQALREVADLPEERAGTVARVAGGSLSRAYVLAGKDELLLNRDLVEEFLRQSHPLSAEALSGLIDRMTSQGRENVRGMLDLLLTMVRDIMLYRSMGADAALTNVDKAEVIARFCNGVPDADVEAMVEHIEAAREMIRQYVHVGLTLTVLAHRLHRAMRGETTEMLAAPLTARERDPDT